MRWPAIIALCLAPACAPPLQEAEAPDTGPDTSASGRHEVSRWFIVTQGDQPPSCDERLAADGLGPDEDPLGIPLEIVHLNELRGMRLAALSYTVDGACSFSWDFDSGRSEPNQLNVFRAPLSPGEHEVALVAAYGAKYESDESADRARYELKVRGKLLLNLDSATRLFVTSYEHGALTTPIEKRAALKFELGELTSPPVLLRPR